ncbi:MAG: hypothetical protein K6G91_14495 [Kiritimatiellae bacterium]|nr:hypothetical protein [Kiritimatiellia bacterium]
MNITVNRIVAAVLTALAVGFADAAQSDALLAFSTKGPDKYADGTSVLEGEVYALVWVRNGFEFKGVDMNGAAVDAENNAVVAALPIARRSLVRRGAVHCPFTLFQIAESFASSHVGGSFSLVLLDTRVADGKGGFKAAGVGVVVQGWGEVEGSRVKAVPSVMAFATNAAKLGAKILAQSSAPAGESLSKPEVTGIRVEGGLVKLTVKGTDARLLYNVRAGGRPDLLDRPHFASNAVQGGAGEITLTAPATAGAAFFQVTRN